MLDESNSRSLDAIRRPLFDDASDSPFRPIRELSKTSLKTTPSPTCFVGKHALSNTMTSRMISCTWIT